MADPASLADAANHVVLQSLSIGRLPEQLVHCAALGGSVRVRGLPLSRRMALRDGEDDPRLFPSRLLAACCVDDAGRPLASPEDWDAFAGQHPSAASDLVEVAARLCGADSEAIAGN